MRFVLVHGGFHGAWCWSRLIPELEGLGHEAVAIDLPGHGQRRDQPSTLAGRRDAILEVLRPGDVLVGHSGGGYDITLAADAAPEKVGHLVYLAAALPIEGRPLIEASGGRPAEEVGDGGKTQLMSDETGMMRFIRLDARGRMECVDYEAVLEPTFPRGRRGSVREHTGQTMLPVIETADGNWVRDESKVLIEQIEAGRYD